MYTIKLLRYSNCFIIQIGKKGIRGKLYLHKLNRSNNSLFLNGQVPVHGSICQTRTISPEENLCVGYKVEEYEYQFSAMLSTQVQV